MKTGIVCRSSSRNGFGGWSLACIAFSKMKKTCIEEKPFLFAYGKVCWISEMKEMNHRVSNPPWTSRWQSWTDGAHLLGAQQTGQSRCGCGSSRESCWWCRGMISTCQGVAKLDLAIPLLGDDEIVTLSKNSGEVWVSAVVSNISPNSVVTLGVLTVVVKSRGV